jgi:hypothetical protein
MVAPLPEAYTIGVPSRQTRGRGINRGGGGASAGRIYVVGMTSSPGFPGLKPFQKSLAGDFDAYVPKFRLGD